MVFAFILAVIRTFYIELAFRYSPQTGLKILGNKHNPAHNTGDSRCKGAEFVFRGVVNRGILKIAPCQCLRALQQLFGGRQNIAEHQAGEHNNRQQTQHQNNDDNHNGNGMYLFYQIFLRSHILIDIIVQRNNHICRFIKRGSIGIQVNIIGLLFGLRILKVLAQFHNLRIVLRHTLQLFPDGTNGSGIVRVGGLNGIQRSIQRFPVGIHGFLDSLIVLSAVCNHGVEQIAPDRNHVSSGQPDFLHHGNNFFGIFHALL